jgi:hypothetical protein
LRPTLGSWPKESLGHGKNETPTQMKIFLCLVVKKNIVLSTNLFVLGKTTTTHQPNLQIPLSYYTSIKLLFDVHIQLRILPLSVNDDNILKTYIY